jgi:hypothetical protein
MTACTRVGAGTTNETHWTERAAALLAPVPPTASLTERPIEDVLRWTLRQDLTRAMEVLADGEHSIAADVLFGIQCTDTRERSSIFSAAAGVLSVLALASQAGGQRLDLMIGIQDLGHRKPLPARSAHSLTPLERLRLGRSDTGGRCSARNFRSSGAGGPRSNIAEPC